MTLGKQNVSFKKPSCLPNRASTGNFPILIVMFLPIRSVSINIEACLFDRVFNKENFYEKGMQKTYSKI